jgi:hypothetical protein
MATHGHTIYAVWMANYSKSRIDRAGAALARDRYRTDDEYLESDDVLDNYRAAHLEPLTWTTATLQEWLDEHGKPYYLAQRLKRKPQILRKLARLKVRLSQLQDIGGLRVIVPTNRDVDLLMRFLKQQLDADDNMSLVRTTDYRDHGRDRTGYRALHVILGREQRALELQIRSRMQHAWAENIERTSVIYGFHLKEEEGDPAVLGYFQLLSEAFYQVEAGRDPNPALRLEIDKQREVAERIIVERRDPATLSGEADRGVVKAIASRLQGSGGISNWILVFDWNSGSFVSWTEVPRSPSDAMELYVESERTFRAGDGFEVVLVGASEPETLEQTHAHYFGVARYDEVLESLDVAVDGLSARLGLGLDERELLLALHRRHKWGAGRVSRDTLHNVYCPSIRDLDEAISSLVAKGFLHSKGGYSLNQQAKAQIEAVL